MPAKEMGCTQLDNINDIKSTMQTFAKSMEVIQQNYIRLEERQKAQYDLVDRTMNAIANNAQNITGLKEISSDINARTLAIEKKLDNGINTKIADLGVQVSVVRAWVDDHGKNRKPTTRFGVVLDDLFNIIEKHKSVFRAIIVGLIILVAVSFGLLTIEDLRKFIFGS